MTISYPLHHQSYENVRSMYHTEDKRVKCQWKIHRKPLYFHSQPIPSAMSSNGPVIKLKPKQGFKFVPEISY